jgi:hypothetical protein
MFGMKPFRVPFWEIVDFFVEDEVKPLKQRQVMYLERVSKSTKIDI